MALYIMQSTMGSCCAVHVHTCLYVKSMELGHYDGYYTYYSFQISFR